MPKIDLSTVEKLVGTDYPAPFDEPVRRRMRQALGDAAGLTQFGVNLVRLPPGTWSSQRHWHALEDEFVHVVEGELVMITDAGETIMRAGDCAGFKAGVRDGHHFQNRSSRDAVILAIGSRNAADWGEYPDIDLRFEATSPTACVFKRKDGTPY